jgi:probable F420-dependent oxidoreductase
MDDPTGAGQTCAGNVMKFSTGLPGVSRYPPTFEPWEATLLCEDFQRVAAEADNLGYDAIIVPEHIVLPEDLVESMGANWPHALTVMSFVAGATKRIRVNASVMVLPYHHPVVLAKAIATLDVLSGGRAMASFGVGHAAGEFAALGIPFTRRGRITDEYLQAMMCLWTADRPEFHGEFVDFKGVAFQPRPVQQPHPPIWIGGNSSSALRRAARFGSGWMPWLVTVDELPARLDELRRQPGFETRAASFDIAMPVAVMKVSEDDHRPLAGTDGRPDSPSGTQAVIDAVGRLSDLGVTWTSIPAPGRPRSLEEHLDFLRWGAEEVIPAFR